MNVGANTMTLAAEKMGITIIPEGKCTFPIRIIKIVLYMRLTPYNRVLSLLRFLLQIVLRVLTLDMAQIGLPFF